jgi:hypothetical protein
MMVSLRLLLLVLLTPLGLLALQEPAQAIPESLRTHAERSDWSELTPHDEVLRFYRELTRLAPEARMSRIGSSREGRPLHLVTLSRPAVSEPWEAQVSGRPVLFIAAQVHGDEQAGKEGLMLFARELAFGDLQSLLDDLVVLIAPQINPDGGEAGSWGTRANRAGYNVNRDYIRLVNPEARAVVQGILNPWRPHVIVDAHELTGFRWYDFYALHPSNLNVGAGVRSLASGPATRAVQEAIEGAGYTYFPYHLQPSDPTTITEEGILGAGYAARTLRTYGGVRGAVTLLFESRRDDDARVDLEPRTRWQRLAMTGLAEWTAANAQEILDSVGRDRREIAERGAQWNELDSIVVRTQFVSSGMVDYRMPEVRARADGDGWERTGEILDLHVPAMDSAVSVLSRVRPVGYLIEPHREELAQHLVDHGLQVERISEPSRIEVESFRVDSVQYSEETYEGYIPRDVWTSLEGRTVEFPAGAFLVRSDQPMAPLAFLLLEPEDVDSFASMGALAAEKAARPHLPIHRLRSLPAVSWERYGSDP